MSLGKGNLGGTSDFGKGTTIASSVGSQQANLRISHSGKGTLVSLGNGDNSVRLFSINIDGSHLTQISLGNKESIKLEIPFKTSYAIYENALGTAVVTNHRTDQNIDEVLSVGAIASTAQTTKVSDVGTGVIKMVSLSTNPTLIVDGVTLIDTNAQCRLLTEIKYKQSFDFQASAAGEFFYNKIS